MMIDTHCHLNDDLLFASREEVVSRAKQAGVDTFLVVGWDLPSSRKAIQIAQEFEGAYAAIGIHPENLAEAQEEDLLALAELSKREKVVAIGEIGLDYHWFSDPQDREKQKVWFRRQIELANSLRLPISIHSRDAAEDTLRLLSECTPAHGGVLHCYSASPEMLPRFSSLGLYFGFDGPITYKNAVAPKLSVQRCPLDRLLTETDAPYLSPVPFRGKTNEPARIREIIAAMAELRNMTVPALEAAINENFKTLFRRAA